MQRPWKWIAVAMLTAVAGRDARAAAPACPASVDTSPAMRRAAILSVYFHSHYANADWLPAELRPVDLVDAACVLRAATGHLAESRRRRAIAHLVVAGLDDPARCQAALTLDAPVDQLQAVLRGVVADAAGTGAAVRTAATPAATTPCQAGRLPQALPRAEALTAILARLEELRGQAIPDCDYEFHPAKTAFDPKTGITSAAVDAAVQRPAAEVCAVMDPQNWDVDDCSDYFTEVYVARKTGDDYVVSKDFRVAEDPAPPPPCSPYHRELFEHFDVNFKYPNAPGGLVVAWYKNLLGIDSKPLAGKAHAYTYKLFRSLGSSVYLDVRPGGLGYDDGTITLAPRPGDERWTELHLTKEVQFTDRPWIDWSLNLWASTALQAMAEELPEMACCRP